jgi:DNA polymerase
MISPEFAQKNWVASTDSIVEWQRVAQFRLRQNTNPEAFDWSAAEDEGWFFGRREEAHADSFPLSVAVAPPLHLGAAFMKSLRTAGRHRSPYRWKVLYRVAWRLSHGGESRLMDDLLDPDVHELQTMSHEVRIDARRCMRNLRFVEAASPNGQPHAVAWLRPRHHIVPVLAPVIVRKRGHRSFSLFTPDVCAHWRRSCLSYTPGLPLDTDPPEEMWATLS